MKGLPIITEGRSAGGQLPFDLLCGQCLGPSSKSPEMEAGRVVIVTSKSPNKMWPITAMRIDTASTVYPTSKIHGKACKEPLTLPCSQR